MRTNLVVAVFGALAMTGCSTPDAAPAPEMTAATPLTAVAALGDFSTIDYCSLLELAATQDSSFEQCGAEVTEDGVQRAVVAGPLTSNADSGAQPYDYQGTLPAGVSVLQSPYDTQTACTRVIAFADGIRLNISVTDLKPAPPQGRCHQADAAVGTALAAITGGHVRRLAFVQDSWGRVAPCALLDDHALDASSGPGTTPTPGVSGHSCIRGKVSLKLSIVPTPAGPTEQVGGRPARVAVQGPFCAVDAMQPASGVPGRSEQAEVSVVATDGTTPAPTPTDATCATARAAAAAVLPRLPHA